MGVRVTWQDNNIGEDGHRIYRATSPMDPNSLPTPLATVGANVTMYEDASVSEETTYYYRVSAYQGGAERVSDEVSVYVPGASALPEILDDNTIADVDTSTTSGWTGTSLASVAGNLVLTGTGGTNEVIYDFTGPSSGDFIFYAKLSADNAAGSSCSVQIGQVGSGTMTISLGQNWATSSVEVNRVSAWINGGIQGPLIDFSAQAVEVMLHFDSRLGVGNFYVRQAGKWVFYGGRSTASPYRSKFSMYTGGSDNNDMTVYDLFIARPNLVVIGDSIAAGHNLYDPDPAYYAGTDNYLSTWMGHAPIYPSLRNNLIVNYGEGGEDSSEIDARVTSAMNNTHARVAFLHCSTNDYGAAISLSARTTNIQASVNKVAAAGADVVLLNSVYPNSDAADYIAATEYYTDWWADERPSVTGVDLAIDIMADSGILDGLYMDPAYVQSDGVHPNVSGYELIGQLILSQ